MLYIFFFRIFKIYIHYNKLNELHEILETYSNRHIDYLNAQKYLFEFEITHLNKLSLTSFQVNLFLFGN